MLDHIDSGAKRIELIVRRLLTLGEVLSAVLRLLHPIAPFLTEEIHALWRGRALTDAGRAIQTTSLPRR